MSNNGIYELSKDTLRLVSIIENYVNSDYDKIEDDNNLTKTYMNLRQVKRDVEGIQSILDRKIESYDKEA